MQACEMTILSLLTRWLQDGVSYPPILKRISSQNSESNFTANQDTSFLCTFQFLWWCLVHHDVPIALSPLESFYFSTLLYFARGSLLAFQHNSSQAAKSKVPHSTHGRCRVGISSIVTHERHYGFQSTHLANPTYRR
jgi:hypothetical protein